MVPRPNASKDLFYLLAVVVAVVAIATLYFARIVLIPFALALLFTFILTPSSNSWNAYIRADSFGASRGAPSRWRLWRGGLDGGEAVQRSSEPTPGL